MTPPGGGLCQSSSPRRRSITRCRTVGSVSKVGGIAGDGAGPVTGTRVGRGAALAVHMIGRVAAGSCAQVTFPPVRGRYQAHRRHTASTSISPRPPSWSWAGVLRIGRAVLASHTSTVRTASQTVRRSPTTSSGRLAFTAFDVSSQATSSPSSTASDPTAHPVNVRMVVARACGTALTAAGKCATAPRNTGDASPVTLTPGEHPEHAYRPRSPSDRDLHAWEYCPSRQFEPTAQAGAGPSVSGVDIGQRSGRSSVRSPRHELARPWPLSLQLATKGPQRAAAACAARCLGRQGAEVVAARRATMTTSGERELPATCRGRTTTVGVLVVTQKSNIPRPRDARLTLNRRYVDVVAKYASGVFHFG